jgi:hypothetical protein
MSRQWWTVGLAAAVVLGAWVCFKALGPSGEGARADALAGQTVLTAFQEEKQPETDKKKAAAGKKKAAAEGQPAPAAPPSASEAGVPILSNGDSYDDFASVAQASDGTLYAAYAAYYDAHDQIRLHKLLPNGRWSTRTHVPLVQARADIWMPQLAVDASDRLWVIWCEQTDLTRTESGNWDLYARSLKDETWGPIVRLTDDPKPDINPHVTVDAHRNIHVVWQAHPQNVGNVQYCRFDGQQWSKPLAVTSGATSDWYPQVAVDAKGVAWIAFDSYRNGDYDVLLTSVRDGKAGDVIPIAKSNYYEAHASVACTPDGRVWVSWEQGGFNWGKDQGHWLRLGKRDAGTTLGSSRAVKVAAYENGRVWAAPDVASALAEGRADDTAMGLLAADSEGRLWLRFRNMRRGQVLGTGRFTRYWAENVTYLTPDGWHAASTLAGSNGRISVFSRILPARDGGLHVAYSSDQRSAANYHQPIHEHVLVTTLAKPEARAGAPQLEPYEPPAPPAGMKPWDSEREGKEVAAAREHRVEINGQSMRIVRGDLHRHTELSWDVGPGNDGSYLDFYRYMIDVASMDFGGLTDHQGGGHYAYHWWLTEKSCDMYYLAPRFVPLYGYERSARFPNGHRNVFHSYRGVPVFPFQTKLDLTGVFPGVGSGDLVQNDTKLLYEYLHRTKGVAISHTSGTDTMGTDWRDNDPLIEPVVEVYQGARNSYEVVGGPRVHDISTQPASAAPGGYQEAGMVWNALAKGYRLGMTASSDHGSTHISYSLVYTPANERESILNAIRQRHTYGGTDNLIVEAWCNGRFMGEEFETKDRPSLQLKVTGTDTIARIDLVRNGQYIYTSSPSKQAVDVKFVDMKPDAGLNYYYFRIQQDNGEVAWASPVWVNYKVE